MTFPSVSGIRGRARTRLIAAALLGAGVLGLAAVRASRPVQRGATVGALGPFRVGDEVRNRARVTVRLDLGRGAPPQQLELEGAWRTTVTEVDGGLARVACQLEGLQARATEGGGEPAPEAGVELARELGRRFFVSQRANGEVFDVWLPRGMKPAMANILLTLVGEAQLVRPAQARTAWIVEERDINGAYMAAYQETAPGRFHKQKARYLDVATAVPGAAAPAQPQLRIDRSDIDLVADTHDRLVELRADDAMTVTFSGLSFNVRLRFSLAEPVALSNSVAIGDFARVKAELEPHPMAQLGLDPVAEAARQDRALLAGASGDMLVAELRALPSDAPRGRAASALLARWEALLRLEPTTADRARGLVLSEPALQGKLMVDALSSAGTDQAQSALAAIAADPGARTTLRLSATQYLGVQRSPAPTAVSGLRALLDDHNRELAQSAVLALGACARSLRATAPDRARELVGELHRRLAGVRSAEARQDLVVALGNAGDPSSLPILRGLIESESPRQTETDHGGNPRLVAVEALRFIEDPAVDPLLGSLLERASDASGRFAAITAIRFRNIGPFAAQLAEIARRDRVEPLRYAAIDLLGSHCGDLPALRPVLEDVARSDPEPRNRALAARYLARG